MSSGPDMVHDEDADSEDCDSVWPVSALGRGAGVGLAKSGFSSSLCFRCESSSLMEAVDAITQDSPRTERSGVRGGSVDMMLVTYPFKTVRILVRS